MDVSNTVVTIDLGTTIDQVKFVWDNVVIYIALVVALASGVSAIFKQKETGILGKIQALINLIALNVGYAKNKGPAPEVSPAPTEQK